MVLLYLGEREQLLLTASPHSVSPVAGVSLVFEIPLGQGLFIHFVIFIHLFK